MSNDSNVCRDCKHTSDSSDFWVKDSSGEDWRVLYCKRNKSFVYHGLQLQRDCFEKHIEPCPFCGEKKNLLNDCGFVYCLSCKTCGPDETPKESSIELWNKRK